MRAEHLINSEGHSVGNINCQIFVCCTVSPLIREITQRKHGDQIQFFFGRQEFWLNDTVDKTHHSCNVVKTQD